MGILAFPLNFHAFPAKNRAFPWADAGMTQFMCRFNYLYKINEKNQLNLEFGSSFVDRRNVRFCGCQYEIVMEI